MGCCAVHAQCQWVFFPAPRLVPHQLSAHLMPDAPCIQCRGMVGLSVLMELWSAQTQPNMLEAELGMGMLWRSSSSPHHMVMAKLASCDGKLMVDSCHTSSMT